MDDQKQEGYQEELRRIDVRLQELRREHPVFVWLFAVGLTFGVLGAAMLLKQFFKWLGR